MTETDRTRLTRTPAPERPALHLMISACASPKLGGVTTHMSFATPMKVQYLSRLQVASIRNIIPHSLRFGLTDGYSEPHWLLLAEDIDENKYREFALKDIMPIRAKGELT